MKLFKVEESDSALKEFAKVYSISGVEEFGPLNYLQYARQNMTNVLKNNRRTKLKWFFDVIWKSWVTLERLYNHPLFTLLLRSI